MSASPLRLYSIDRYPVVKAQHPSQGRRWLNLKIAEEFWSLSAEAKLALSKNEAVASAKVDLPIDDDPLDEITTQRPEIGIVLRTDFSDEDAWTSFYNRLQEGEKEFAEVTAVEEDTKEGGPTGDNQASPLEAQDEPMDESDEDSEDSPPIFHVISPSLPQEQALFANISNLSALRLLNDVDVRAAPPLPAGDKRIKPPNRLVDHDRWQEIYHGKTIWIYDSKSNIDQCARLVSKSGHFYGTATGDSWRARVTHICELQVNLYSGAMEIDFGGLDRWDWSERRRNMEEASSNTT